MIETAGQDRGPGRGVRRRRRPAPDVGRAVHLLREPAHLAELRRPRHHGLRRPGGDGCQVRPPGRRGVGDRRRRLLPDDQSGAGHLRRRGRADQGRRRSTTATWAWCGSGRRCSTRSATARPNLATHSHRIPDFVKLAEALGCVGLRCERAEDVVDVINQARAINDRPVVIDFIVGADAQVWPMVAAGTSNDEIRRRATSARCSTTRGRAGLMTDHDAHAVGARRGQARRARPRGVAVLPARLQHPVAGRRRHRAEEPVADDDRGLRRGASRSSRSPSSSTS